MEVKYWEGGLTLHEVRAIEKISRAFEPKESAPASPSKKLGSLNDLRILKKSGSTMFPWKGYAGFRLIGSGKEGEFDLVIITHYNAIIVELKHWSGELTACGDNWYQNGEYRERSAVSKTQDKQFLLKTKLEKCGRSFPSFDGHKFSKPKVDFVVVLTGSANGVKLPPKDKEHVLTLDEFILLADESNFNKKFRPHPEANKSLNKDISVFDSIFSEGETRPKSLVVGGYEAIERIFPPENIKSVYSEYSSKNRNSKDDFALLRRWNFSNFNDNASKTRDERYKIVSHEKEVLSFIRQNDIDLYNSCLRSLTNIDPEDITEEFYELYELPHGHSRFNEYISSHVVKFSDEERLKLIKILLNNFSLLHEIKIAHRDIGDHSLWLSPGKKIALSSFMSAYHKPAGTVGERRETLSAGLISLPENKDGEKFQGTEYEKDIYALGILCWHILEGKRLNVTSIENAVADIKESTEWFSSIFKKATSIDPQDRFSTAGEMRDALAIAQPQKPELKLFDESILEPYKTEIKLYKTFPEDEEIKASDSKEVYRSNDLVVKIWNNALEGDESYSVFSCKTFFDKVEKIQSLLISHIPTIRHVGLTHKSELYLIQDYIDALKWADWAEAENSEENKEKAIKLLALQVNQLHDFDITHGDLHPKNLLVSNAKSELKIYFVDIPDYSLTATEPRNHKYSPENISSASSIERDNYAVMRMACELLNINWESPGENLKYARIIEVIKESKVSTSGFVSLEKFIQAFESESDKINKHHEVTIKFSRRDFSEVLTLYPDNGELLVFIEPSKNNHQAVKVIFSGINSSWTFFFNPTNKVIEGGLTPWKVEGIEPWLRKESQIALSLKLIIEPAHYNDTTPLVQYLLEHESFLIECIETLNNNNETSASDSTFNDETNTQSERFFPSTDEENGEASDFSTLKADKASTRNIWKTILETETEALPYIEVADQPKLDIRKHELVIPYDSDNEVLDRFSNEDDVLAIKIVQDKEFTLGKVNIDQSTSSEIRLPLTSKRHPELGDIIYLRTKRDRASYSRRKKAMERILDKSSVIPDLVNYFESKIDQNFIDYKNTPTDEQLNRYNQYDDEHKLKISLNDDQRKAFRNLFRKGPLSLLQGPPGTGKTEFISAFVHYLLSEGGARHILLVSQSHEAVNTAIERIRKHCIRLETPIDIVRFSNSEASVSEGLKDVYSRNIVESNRQSFVAEVKERIKYIQPTLKLELDYLDAFVSAEFGIKKKVKNFLRLQSDILEIKDAQYEASLSNSLESLRNQIVNELHDIYSIEVSGFELMNVAEKIDKHLNSLYGIGPHEYRRVRTLIDLVADFKDRLSSNPGSYEEFLARSRTLVCGTCVGMGQGHLGLNQIQYDWVIIDEAARSISSELAIAMQSAKRILLVGDHKQLPPLFQQEHKNAIMRKLGLPRVEPFQSYVFKSDFEKAFLSSYGQSVGESLQTQYRMAEPISKMVSDIFYDKPLITGDRVVPDFYKSGVEHLKTAVTWLDTSLINNSYDQEDGTSLINIEEITQIINILKKIESDDDYIGNLSSLVSPGEYAIGVICMYSAQKRLLRRKFNELAWNPDFRDLVKIDTVDSYQGKENRVIIVSITRNGKDRKPKFLKEPNRINVAMSRAMDRLLIVGAMQMWNEGNSSFPLGRIASYIQAHQNDDYKIITAQKSGKQVDGK